MSHLYCGSLPRFEQNETQERWGAVGRWTVACLQSVSGTADRSGPGTGLLSMLCASGGEPGSGTLIPARVLRYSPEAPGPRRAYHPSRRTQHGHLLFQRSTLVQGRLLISPIEGQVEDKEHMVEIE